jgi:porin
LQPDIQYVIRPAGGIINPQAPDKRIADEAVFGVRSTIVF